MSEYQIVKFRAIDRPLTDKQLEYMDRQSSRAEFTKWEFQVDYNYGSFNGNINQMLRNGYDLFLTYTNYGCREIRIRLPEGLPFAKSLWSKYISAEGLTWTADKSGKAGILALAPFIEEGYDSVWEFDDYLDATAKLREMLLAGDLRALYVLWLCHATCSSDDHEAMMEPPVPHGLSTVPRQAAELLAFFETDPLFVEAAAIGIPAISTQDSLSDLVDAWLKTLDESRKNEFVRRLLTDDPVVLKAELLSEVRDSRQATTWPLCSATRTVGQLRKSCELLRQQENEKHKRQAVAKAKRDAAKAEKQRRARMIEMQGAPDVWLNKATQLVEERGNDNYREAANILADLRDALASDQGNKMARNHAAHLAKKHPTLRVLKSHLKKKELLD